jgi:hypothetical protein
MQDLEALLENGTTKHVMMLLLDIAAELMDVETARCLNALSILLDSTGSGIPELQHISSVHPTPSVLM